MGTGKYRKLPPKQLLRFLNPEQKPSGEQRRSCLRCEYFQPDWRFRSCFYAECPYQKGKFTLRSVPFASDPAFMTMKEEVVTDVE